ncbi:MAG TPA: hypothetical protein VF153_08080 [Candidatus Limnocylindria bacterium]
MNSIPRVAAHRRVPRPLARGPKRPLVRPALFAAAGIVIGGLTIGTALAQPRLVGQDEPDPAGSAIQLIDRHQLAPGLAEIRIGIATGASPATGANRLLAVSADAATAAVASQVGPGPATLTLIHRDGGASRVALPGLIGAGFSPDGSWLAAIDGSGAIWRVPLAGYAPFRLADGPFLGTPTVQPDGSVLALRVSSVEAPIVSRLVRIAAGGEAVQLAPDDLVYGAQVMEDGTIAYAAHRGSRTYLMRLLSTGAEELADLGEDAVNVVLSPASDTVAFERDGQIFLQSVAGHMAVHLADGGRPQFAPNGRSILVELVSGSALVGLDGSRLGTFAGQAGFAACGRECQP